MGCSYEFYNITTGQRASPRDPILYRNIDRYGGHHVRMIIQKVRRLEGWSQDDVIVAECCCNQFRACGDSYVDRDPSSTLFSEDNNVCERTPCTICEVFKH